MEIKLDGSLNTTLEGYDRIEFEELMGKKHIKVYKEPNETEDDTYSLFHIDNVNEIKMDN